MFGAVGACEYQGLGLRSLGVEMDCYLMSGLLLLPGGVPDGLGQGLHHMHACRIFFYCARASLVATLLLLGKCDCRHSGRAAELVVVTAVNVIIITAVTTISRATLDPKPMQDLLHLGC